VEGKAEKLGAFGQSQRLREKSLQRKRALPSCEAKSGRARFLIDKIEGGSLLAQGRVERARRDIRPDAEGRMVSTLKVLLGETGSRKGI